MKKKKDVASKGVSKGKKKAKDKKVVKGKKSVSTSKGKKVRKYICPKCKSKNVGKVFNFGTLFGIVPKWRCKDCGLEEMVFPKIVKK